MNRVELKQILKQQAATFEDDIKKKMIALQNDDFLSYDYYNYPTLNKKESEDVFEPDLSLYTQPQFDDEEDDNDSNPEEERRRRIAERIAAIKGKSLPGEYLRKSTI